MRSLRSLLAIGSLIVLSASTMAAQGGKVTCKDGSKSKGGQGACSGHGGVLTPEMKAQMKADAKAAKEAKAAQMAAKRAEMKTAKKAEVAEKRMDKRMEMADKKEMKKDAGMAKADMKADRKAEREDDKDARGATAECKDHTYSHAKTHQGACSRHGGVARFLDGK